MPENLYVRINRPLPLKQLLDCATKKLKEILRLHGNLQIGVQIPRGATFSAAPLFIPNRPRWGLYLYLEDVGNSLVEMHVSSLSDASGEEPTVLYFGELRTSASKALVAALAIAAGELLGVEILDLEHVWTNRGQLDPYDLEERLTLQVPQTDIESALREFNQK